MMIYVLEFLILSSEIFCGTLLAGKLQEDSKENHAAPAEKAALATRTALAHKAVLAVIASLAAAILCFYPGMGENPALITAVLLALILILSKILHPADWKLLLYTCCAYLSGHLLLDAVSYLLLCRYFSVPSAAWLVFLLFYRILFYLVLFCSQRFLECIKHSVHYYKSIYGTSVVAFCGSSILLQMIFTGGHLKSLVFFSVVMVSALFLRLVLAYSHVKYQHEKELLATIEMQKELLEQNYAAVNRAYSQNAKLFHDFHRHLEVIRQLADQSHAQELSQYIDDIITPVQNISSAVWTGSQTVDYILNSRHAKAVKSGISMEMNIEYPYNTSIKPNDLCTILSNLLDNALEAAKALRETKPTDTCRINLTIRRIQNILIIKLENSSPKPSCTPSGELVSSKKEKELLLHGWGMKNIETAVQKYDGVIQTSYSDADHIFQTTITMYFDGVEIDAAKS